MELVNPQVIISFFTSDISFFKCPQINVSSLKSLYNVCDGQVLLFFAINCLSFIVIFMNPFFFHNNYTFFLVNHVCRPTMILINTLLTSNSKITLKVTTHYVMETNFSLNSPVIMDSSQQPLKADNAPHNYISV